MGVKSLKDESFIDLIDLDVPKIKRTPKPKRKKVVKIRRRNHKVMTEENKKEYTDFIDSFPQYLEVNKLLYKPVFHVHTLDDRWRPYVGLRTIRTAISREEFSDEVWMYSNLMISKTVPSRGRYIKKTTVHPGSRNWIIDIDNHPFCKTIEDIKGWVLEKTGELPTFITQTSPESNFHLLFLGPKNFWSDKRTTALIYKLCDIPLDNKYSDEEIQEIIKSYGIDLNNLLQGPWLSKIRVPGTPKAKRNRVYYTTSWWNKLYDCNKFDLPLEEIEAVNPLMVYDQAKSAFIDKMIKSENPEVRTRSMDEVFADTKKRFSEKISKILGEILSPERAVIATDLILRNFGFLKSKKCFISGKKMGDRYGKSQQTASLILRELVKNGVLEMIKDYVYKPGGGGMARVYGLTDEFKKAINYRASNAKTEKQREKSKDSLLKPYEPTGEYINDNFAKDIPRLYTLGASCEDVIRFIGHKLRLVLPEGHRRIRTENTIMKLFYGFAGMAIPWLNFVRETSKFDLDLMIRELEIRHG